MKRIVLVGTQWGDEGKGRFVDFLSGDADVVVRYQGGNNAGHSVELGEEQFTLHLVPSGILSPNKLNIIGNGVVVNPIALVKEMQGLMARGVSMDGLRISDRAHLVLPYHMPADRYAEESRGEADIGTTLKGIGPAYTDKADRCGLRVCDLMDSDTFAAKYRAVLDDKNETFVKIYEKEPQPLQPHLDDVLAAAEQLRPYVCDAITLLHERVAAGDRILFEGAQATLLDIDLGTYPYVTSSHPTSGGVCAGAGVGPTVIDGVLGVVKAYTTRVGKG
ncbi:MAG: adenylosuccinate synthetase, partial [Eubacteriales bacterium]|nr:adenylosuccinate synthetase [Eubacteriales bacterium]